MSEDRVRQAFADQSRACTSLGSSFTGTLCGLIGENLSPETSVGQLCLSWPGDPSSSADNVPLRLCGGFHALVLRKKDLELAEFYPPNPAVVPDWNLLVSVMERHAAFFEDWLKLPPQTNEVARSAVIWPSLMAISKLTDRPLNLIELGSSGGLNLNCARYGYDLGGERCGDPDAPLQLAPEWKGNLPQRSDVEIIGAKGCDLSPVDVTDPQQELRLKSYCWPDQPDRMKRLSLAIETARISPVSIMKMDALEFLEQELSHEPNQECTVVFSTVAWQYLPPEARAEGAEIIKRHARKRGKTSPIAWLRFEADGGSPGGGVHLQIPAHGLTSVLGRADFHGRWVDWVGLPAASD